MFDRHTICLLIMKLLWKHISFAFFCCWSYGSHQLSGHSWLRSNSLLVPQHADRKFLSLRCEPNETSYWHTRVAVWGEYVARCGNTVSLVSNSLQQHYWTVIARSTCICTHRTHRLTVCRIWVPFNYKILHIPCFICDCEIFKINLILLWCNKLLSAIFKIFYHV